MNNDYLERAKLAIPDPKILSIIAAKRAKQLALGMRPMVKCESENWLDVALLEIAEGKLSYEFSDTPEDDIFAEAMNKPKKERKTSSAKKSTEKVTAEDVFGTADSEPEVVEVSTGNEEDATAEKNEES